MDFAFFFIFSSFCIIIHIATMSDVFENNDNLSDNFLASDNERNINKKNTVDV